MEEITKDIMIESPETMSKVFGKYDENIKLIEERLKVDVMVRGGALKIRGESRRVEAAVRVIEEMIRTIAGQGGITKDNTEYILTLQSKGLEKEYSALNDDIICYTMRGKPIRSKTLGQNRYIEANRQNDIVYGIGPAATAKT